MLLSVAALAQDVPSQKVDQIFSVYDKPGSPGCSVGVIRDGEFVYRKAYGLATLELGVPLSPQSVFYIGSVSKQFTAASVVLAVPQLWDSSVTRQPSHCGGLIGLSLRRAES